MHLTQEHGSFQLFFSFDYAGNGAWAKSDVTALIQQYGGNSAHFKRDGKPFVFTFEGLSSAVDRVLFILLSMILVSIMDIYTSVRRLAMLLSH